MASKALTKLNAREQRVVDLWLSTNGGMSQDQAYFAYYKSRQQNAVSQFFGRKVIREYIRERKDESAARVGVTLDRTVQELAALAHSNIKHYYLDEYLNSEGDIDLTLMPDYMTAAIQSIKVQTQRGSTKFKITDIKLHDKIKPADMIMRFLGAYERDNEQQGGDAIVNILQSIADRGMPSPGEIVNGE